MASSEATTATAPPPAAGTTHGTGWWGAGPNALTKAGREAFSYDAAGRMFGYHRFNLECDGQDKLVSATKADGTRIENLYGFDGERVVEVVRRRGRPVEAHRHVFDGYVLHGGADAYLRLEGGMDVGDEVSSAWAMVWEAGRPGGVWVCGESEGAVGGAGPRADGGAERRRSPSRSVDLIGMTLRRSSI